MSLTKAAEQLFMTQPTLSRQISAIEAELNLQLLIRHNRKIKLTPAGTILMQEFQKIYTEYCQAVMKAQNAMKGIIGSLKIGVLAGTNIPDIMPLVLSYFKETYPNVKFIEMRSAWDSSLVVAWNKDNYHPSIACFTEKLLNRGAKIEDNII